MPEEQSVQMDQVESAETDLTVVPPNERIQMQRIRELDLEQLEVEEVDSDTETHQTDDSRLSLCTIWCLGHIFFEVLVMDFIFVWYTSAAQHSLVSIRADRTAILMNGSHVRQ
eukprot:c28226_g1_i2 orf=161-499(-)